MAEETKETPEIIDKKTKIKEGFKKHGKKIAGVAAGVGLAALGFILGAKTAKKDDSEDYIPEDCEDVDVTEF